MVSLCCDPLRQPSLQRQPAPRDVDKHAAPVARVGLPVDEIVGDHPVDQAGEARGRKLRELRELRHPVTVAAREQREGAPALDGAVVMGEDMREAAGDAALSIAEQEHDCLAVGLHREHRIRLLYRHCARVTRASMDPVINVALVIPLHGSAGIFGPSCELCAELAVAEVNAADGVLGRELRLSVIDGSAHPRTVANEVGALAAAGLVDAVVGWHISAVRQAVAPRIAGLVPYVYTALYEGGENAPGVFLTGEVPSQQLLPAMRWLSREHGVRRWSIVGNDYVWPRSPRTPRAGTRASAAGRSATRPSSHSGAGPGTRRSRTWSARAPTP